MRWSANWLPLTRVGYNRRELPFIGCGFLTARKRGGRFVSAFRADLGGRGTGKTGEWWSKLMQYD